MRYHKIDGWRGYSIPNTALVGVTDTGNWSDSPCRPSEGSAELKKFRTEALKPAGIKSRVRFGQTTNVFCGKRWLCVSAADFPRAVPLTLEWLEKNKFTTRLIHEADLQEAVK